LSRLLQFRDINNPFLAGRSRARGLGFTLTPFSDATRGGSGADRGRWSSLRLDKRLFIQRGRKLIHDATSLHFLRVWQARIPLLKRIPSAVRGSEHGATKYEVTAFSFPALLKNCSSPQQRRTTAHTCTVRRVAKKSSRRRMADATLSMSPDEKKRRDRKREREREREREGGRGRGTCFAPFLHSRNPVAVAN